MELLRFPKIEVIQHRTVPVARRVDAAEQLIVVMPHAALRGNWPEFPYRDLLRARLRRTKGAQCDRLLLSTDLPNRGATRVHLACTGTDTGAFERLELARKLAAVALEARPAAVMIVLAGLEPACALQTSEALVAALLAAVAPMPHFKSTKLAGAALRAIDIHGLGGKVDFARTLAEAHGNALARQLTRLPGNHLTPARYRRLVTKLARDRGWDHRFLDLKTLGRANAGAFLAVAQGSPDADAGILHLRYRPRKAKRGAGVSLVGKGICFDTGGTNLKSAKSMLGMHEDMEGSAVALGTLLALSELKVDFAVDCWLALAQNHIGPKAYKPNDVVSASNGTSIEIVHTDAEGRMVLADTLALASATKPRLLIDYATLTGSCVQALGTRYSGACTNRTELLEPIIAAGRASGERVWPFPTDRDYDQALESEIADIKQCTLDNEADHILAARFLGRFVPDELPWIHIDLSAGNHKGGLAHIPTDVTGFGVRYTLNLLLDQKPTR